MYVSHEVPTRVEKQNANFESQERIEKNWEIELCFISIEIWERIVLRITKWVDKVGPDCVFTTSAIDEQEHKIVKLWTGCPVVFFYRKFQNHLYLLI